MPLVFGGSSLAVVVGVTGNGGGFVHFPTFESQRSWLLWRAVRPGGGKGVAVAGVSWHCEFGSGSGG